MDAHRSLVETNYCEVESKFKRYLMKWVTKHDVKLANAFCDLWDPQEQKTNRLDFWKMTETDLQKWKIIDYTAVPIKWETSGTEARNCLAQNPDGSH